MLEKQRFSASIRSTFVMSVYRLRNCQLYINSIDVLERLKGKIIQARHAETMLKRCDCSPKGRFGKPPELCFFNFYIKGPGRNLKKLCWSRATITKL